MVQPDAHAHTNGHAHTYGHAHISGHLSRGPPKVQKKTVRALQRTIFLVMNAQLMNSVIYLPLVLDLMKGSRIKTAKVLGLLHSAGALCELLLGPSFGALTDQVGRRLLMVIAALTLAASRVIAARTRGWWPLMLWRVVSHCAGHFVLIATSASMMDLAKGDKKLIQLLKTGESLVKGIGMATGPLIAGLVSKRFGTRAPFYASAALAAGAALHALACVPETLEVEDRRRFKPRMRKLFGFTKMFTNLRLAKLAVMSMLVDVPLRTGPIFPLMTKYRFGWESDTTGKWVFTYSVCTPLSSMVYAKMLSRYGENVSTNVQTLMSFCAIACLTVSKRGRLFWASIPLFAVGLSKPSAIRGHVTKQFSQEMSIGQGELSGILGSTAMLANTLATQMHSQAFAYFISDAAPFHFPAVPFFLCCISDLLVFALYNLEP